MKHTPLDPKDLEARLQQVFDREPSLVHHPQMHDYQLTYPPAVQIEQPAHRVEQLPSRFHELAVGKLEHMALYFHFGFCAYKCRYCHHYEIKVVRDEALHTRYVDALRIEMRQTKERFGSLRPSYCFLGGGTPSALSPTLIERFLDELHRTFGGVPTDLSTVEVKPVTATFEKLSLYVQAGFLRVSFGVQTLDPALYAYHHHGEHPDVVWRALTMARRAGFSRINIDLMTGLERQTPEGWHQTLQDVERMIRSDLVDSVFIYPYHDDPRSKTFATGASLPTFLETACAETEARAMFERLGWWELGPRFFRSKRHVAHELWDLARTRVSPWYGEFLYAGLGNSAYSVGDRMAWLNERDVVAYCERLESGRPALSHAMALDDRRRAIRDLTFDLLYSPIVRVRSLARRYGAETLTSQVRMLEHWADLGLGRWNPVFGTWRLSSMGKLLHQQMLPLLYLAEDSAGFRAAMDQRRALGRRYRGY